MYYKAPDAVGGAREQVGGGPAGRIMATSPMSTTILRAVEHDHAAYRCARARIDCTVLYCTVLYCTVLYCTVLYCTVLYCTVLYCTVLYCTVPYLKCPEVCCSALQWAVLYCYATLCAPADLKRAVALKLWGRRSWRTRIQDGHFGCARVKVTPGAEAGVYQSPPQKIHQAGACRAVLRVFRGQGECNAFASHHATLLCHNIILVHIGVDLAQEWEQVDHAVLLIGYGKDEGKDNRRIRPLPIPLIGRDTCNVIFRAVM